jgi:hypothetical protein
MNFLIYLSFYLLFANNNVFSNTIREVKRFIIDSRKVDPNNRHIDHLEITTHENFDDSNGFPDFFKLNFKSDNQSYSALYKKENSPYSFFYKDTFARKQLLYAYYKSVHVDFLIGSNWNRSKLTAFSDCILYPNSRSYSSFKNNKNINSKLFRHTRIQWRERNLSKQFHILANIYEQSNDFYNLYTLSYDYYARRNYKSFSEKDKKRMAKSGTSIGSAPVLPYEYRLGKISYLSILNAGRKTNTEQNDYNGTQIDMIVEACVHVHYTAYEAIKIMLQFLDDDYAKLFTSILFQSIISGIDEIYKKISNLEPSFSIKVDLVDLVVHTSKEPPYNFTYLNVSAIHDDNLSSSMLRNGSGFVYEYLSKQKATEKCDHVFLMHDYMFKSVVGEAYFGSACEPSIYTSANKFFTAYQKMILILAHELGHSLGSIILFTIYNCILYLLE